VKKLFKILESEDKNRVKYRTIGTFFYKVKIPEALVVFLREESSAGQGIPTGREAATCKADPVSVP
jgi:hypothetical protein